MHGADGTLPKYKAKRALGDDEEIAGMQICPHIAKSMNAHPVLGTPKVLLNHGKRMVSEITEAFYVNLYKDDCVSQTSIPLLEKEAKIDGHMLR